MAFLRIIAKIAGKRQSHGGQARGGKPAAATPEALHQPARRKDFQSLGDSPSAVTGGFTKPARLHRSARPAHGMQAGERRALDLAQYNERGIAFSRFFQSGEIITRTFLRVRG